MWQVEGEWASLKARRFVARVRPSHPREGLRDVEFDGHRIADARLLQLRSLETPYEKSLPDCFLRGSHLAVQYAPSTDFALSCEVLWRMVESTEPRAVGVELIVSVQTEQADTDATISFGSEIPCTEILHLCGDNAQRVSLSGTTNGLGALDANPICRPGPLLYRLPGGRVSCVEMVHPTDFQTGQIQIAGAEGVLARSTLTLFAERLEKGVILRARAQALFLPAENDEADVSDCYARFEASPAPLSA